MASGQRVSRSGSGIVAKVGARVLSNRRLMRAPIWMYRARIGFLFGQRLLMLEHVGRKSRLRRYVVLEVFDRPAPDTYVVVSGFGSRAQWFRNVLADPHVRVWVGGRAAVPAVASRLTPSEADQALAAYATRHPRAWARFRPVVEATLGSSIADHDTALPMIGLRLRR